MKKNVKYLIAIGLVATTYCIPYLAHPLILGSSQFDNLALNSEGIWLSILILSTTCSILSFFIKKYNSLFSVYSFLLGLSTAYLLIGYPDLRELIIYPLLLGIVLFYLHIKNIKKKKKIIQPKASSHPSAPA